VRTKLIALAALALVAGSNTARSGDLDDLEVVHEIATLLGSEAACNLHFDQKAIERLIATRVAPDNLHFASRLGTYVRNEIYSLKDMPESARTAHCAQIRQVAHHYDLESK
jgi:hypothetical protein